MRVVIVGGGIAGLAAAEALLELAPGAAIPEVSVLEAASRAGGKIRSETVEGNVVEWGPNGFLDREPATMRLCERLGLDPLRADESAARRFLWRAGRLRELPTGPLGLLFGGALPFPAALRVLMDPLVRSRSPEGESVHAFAARRIGRTAADLLVQAMVSGIHGGDAKRLEVAAAFPRLVKMEREHGSLVQALRALARARKREGTAAVGGPSGPGGVLRSFPEGMERLVDALVHRLGARLRLRMPVEALVPLAEGWRVDTPEGAEMVDRVILACPADEAARLIRGFDEGAAASLAGVPYAPLSVVVCGYRDPPGLRERVQGFGFLEDAPRYEREQARPSDLEALWANRTALAASVDVGAVLLRLLDDPALGDRSWVYEQYDHMLFLQTVVEPGNDGSLLRIRDTEKGLAVSTDGDALRCFLDPRRGAERLVYEAALNVAVTGAGPYALVDNLNFGNPEKPEIMWQFVETIEGMAAACEALGVPVVGGNVSFYNETDGVDIYPTPVVGMLGFCDPMPQRPPRLDRAEDGMELWLVGPELGNDFAASAYGRVVLDHLGGRPEPIHFDVAGRVVAHATRLAYELPVLHDLSAGGLAIAVAEICIRSDIGAAVEAEDWTFLLDEAPGRFLTVAPAGTELRCDDVPVRLIGRMGGGAIDFGPHGSVAVAEAAQAWRDAIPRRMEK